MLEGDSDTGGWMRNVDVLEPLLISGLFSAIVLQQ
jgi:hypothetical protein